MVFLSAGGKTYRTMEVMTIKNSSSFRMHINRDHCCNLYEKQCNLVCCVRDNIIVEFKMVFMGHDCFMNRLRILISYHENGTFFSAFSITLLKKKF